MAAYGMIINVDRCIGCYNCYLACRDEHAGLDHLPYSLGQPRRGPNWAQIVERERGQYPWVKTTFMFKPCLHCDHAPCIEAAPNGAIYKRPDGIVIIDPIKSIGQRQVVSACPHRVISWNEERNVPQKCTLCAHLLDRGEKEPRCVEVCPTGALVFGDLEDPNSEVRQVMREYEVEELHPEYGLAPRVNYIAIPKRFIAGTVVFGDSGECAAGVNIKLRSDKVERSTKTNAFGDFEIDGLDVGEYTVMVAHEGYAPQRLTVATRQDVYLGEITLAR